MVLLLQKVHYKNVWNGMEKIPICAEQEKDQFIFILCFIFLFINIFGLLFKIHMQSNVIDIFLYHSFFVVNDIDHIHIPWYSHSTTMVHVQKHMVPCHTMHVP